MAWSRGPVDGDQRPTETDAHRRVGFRPADLDGLVTVPDDVDALMAAVAGSEIAFAGAYVPLVIHDPLLAERSFDAAEWGAELIRTAGGRSLVVTPCAEPEWVSEPGPSHRSWNHAAAMFERLEAVCDRFGLGLATRDVVRDVDMRDPLDPERPIRHLLDSGRYLAEGFRPIELRSPDADEVDGGIVERVRGLLRDRL